MDKIRSFISNFEINDAQWFLLKISSFIPILLLVMAINYGVDPTGIYRKAADKYKSSEYQIALTLAGGRNVELMKEKVNDRLIVKYLIENMTAAPDIAILGSSHSMWLGENVFPDKRVSNNSVLGAVLADYLAIYEGYARKGIYPKRIICVLDPQLIVSPVPSEKWVAFKEDTSGMLQRLGIASEKIRVPALPQELLNILSFSYFQKSVSLFFHRHSDRVFRETDAVSGKNVILKDGRRSLWSEHSRAKDAQESRRRTIIGLHNGKQPWGMHYWQKDDDLDFILEKFIRYMDGHGKVTLFLLPFNPQEYKRYQEAQKKGYLNLVTIEHYYRQLAQRANVEIRGSYDPAACGLQESDFYDQEHLRTDAVERIFKQNGSICSLP
jgi:hypothetical protein